MKIKIENGQPGTLLVSFGYSQEYYNKVIQIKGCQWSSELKKWIMPHNNRSINKLMELFDPDDIIDCTSSVNAGTSLKADSRIMTAKEIMKELDVCLKLKGYSSKTAGNYKGQMKRYLEHVNNDTSIAFNKNEVEKYMLHLLENLHASHSYINQAVSAIKFYMRYSEMDTALELEVPRPKKEKKLPEVLSQNEVLKILGTVTNLKHKAIFYLIYSAGLRIGEAVNLKVGDIDKERMLIRVSQGKGRKDRYTLLSEVALNVLREYYQQYRPITWLFPGEDGDKHITDRSIQRAFEYALAKSGVHKNVSVHSLRHSFATHLLESGVDLRYIQELLGHQSTKTTEIYTHVTSKSIKNIVSPLDRISIK